MSTEDVNKENRPFSPDITNANTHRRSLAAPMHKLMRRLSGMPSENKTSEVSTKARLSFQTWKRRKSINERRGEEKESEKKHALVRPSLLQSNPMIRVGLTKYREPLKRAPIAEAEEVTLQEAKRPKLIATAARRLSNFSAKPIKGNHYARSKRRTEVLSPIRPSKQRHHSTINDMGQLLRNHLEESSYFPLPDDLRDNHSSPMEMEDDTGIRQRISVSEFPQHLPLTGVLLNGDIKRTPSFGPPSLSAGSSVPSGHLIPKEMIRMAGKTLFNKEPHLGINFLLQQRILSPEPQKIAEFLTEDGISRQAIGEYFGRISDPLANKVTEEFIRRLNLHHVEMDVALRRLLQQVHPDGESQKIEFLLQVLTKCYIEQNPEVTQQFHDRETLGVLAYSIMLLHTTFYNQNARRLGKIMNKTDFINNNRGIDGGQDISMHLLEGIYDRVRECEFKTLPDPVDRLLRVDKLLTGPRKPEKLTERHRRFIAWFSASEVSDFTTRKPLIPRPSSQVRSLFIFNDLLVIAKPVGSNRTNAVDEMSGCESRRRRSIDRLVGRVNSPLSRTSMSPPRVTYGSRTPNLQKHYPKGQDIRIHCQYSPEIPPIGLYLVRQIIPLFNVKVLNFECEYYKFGVQLCDEFNVLTSINLPTDLMRKKFTDLLHEAIWETEVIINFSGAESRQSNTSSRSGERIVN